SPLSRDLLPLYRVHELKIEVQCGISLDEPAEIPLRLTSVPEEMKSPERVGRVSDPRITIVPVFVFAERLRQRGGGCGDYGSRRGIDKHLQGECGSYDLSTPSTPVQKLSDPGSPEDLRLTQSLSSLVLLHLTGLSLPIAQDECFSIAPRHFKLR